MSTKVISKTLLYQIEFVCTFLLIIPKKIIHTVNFIRKCIYSWSCVTLKIIIVYFEF